MQILWDTAVNVLHTVVRGTQQSSFLLSGTQREHGDPAHKLPGQQSICAVFQVNQFRLKTKQCGDWRDGSAVANPDCSSRGTGFNSQPPHGSF